MAIRHARAGQPQCASLSRDERDRIGSELHDGVAQVLAGVSLLVSSVAGRLPPDTEPLRDELARIQQLLTQSIESCRSLAHAVTPSVTGPTGSSAERPGDSDAAEPFGSATRE